jgi:hypothetical protein
MGNAHNFRTEGKLTTSAKINLPSRDLSFLPRIIFLLLNVFSREYKE